MTREVAVEDTTGEKYDHVLNQCLRSVLVFNRSGSSLFLYPDWGKNVYFTAEQFNLDFKISLNFDAKRNSFINLLEFEIRIRF